jgi:hypothetical protein
MSSSIGREGERERDHVVQTNNGGKTGTEKLRDGWILDYPVVLFLLYDGSSPGREGFNFCPLLTCASLHFQVWINARDWMPHGCIYINPNACTCVSITPTCNPPFTGPHYSKNI